MRYSPRFGVAADLAVAADLVVAADLAVAVFDCASNTAAAADLAVAHDLHDLHSNYRYQHHHVVGHRDWDCRTVDLAVVVVDSDLNFHIGDWCYPVAAALGGELQRDQMEVVGAKDHHQHLEEVGAVQSQHLVAVVAEEFRMD